MEEYLPHILPEFFMDRIHADERSENNGYSMKSILNLDITCLMLPAADFLSAIMEER
jgi:hypothetical protein